MTITMESKKLLVVWLLFLKKTRRKSNKREGKRKHWLGRYKQWRALCRKKPWKNRGYFYAFLCHSILCFTKTHIVFVFNIAVKNNHLGMACQMISYWCHIILLTIVNFRCSCCLSEQLHASDDRGSESKREVWGVWERNGLWGTWQCKSEKDREKNCRTASVVLNISYHGWCVCVANSASTHWIMANEE